MRKSRYGTLSQNGYGIMSSHQALYPSSLHERARELAEPEGLPRRSPFKNNILLAYGFSPKALQELG
jgi:hypothetical protein